MNSLEPNKVKPVTPSNNKSLSIFQSKRVIDDLQNSLDRDTIEEDSSAYYMNRQISTGMILDMRYFDENSKIKKQLLCKNGEEDQGVIFSFMVLKQEKGEPLQIIYRWIRKPKNELSKGKEVAITEQEHIYQGGMKNKRKHGQGQYIIIQKLSNATEKQIRYKGTWIYDIFSQGTIQNQLGQVKRLSNTHISLKTKANLKGKSERNATIKNITAQMGKKKSAKVINGRYSNESFSSIKQAIVKRSTLPNKS